MAAKKRALPSWMTLTSECQKINEREKNGEKEKLLFKDRKKFKEEKRILASAEFDKKLQEHLPELTFTGNIVYSFNSSDCGALCEDIELSLCDAEAAFIGFDMEWPVTYQVGKESSTAVIQICTGPKICFIFHLTVMGSLPKPLQYLIQSPHIQKVGIGIESDLWKLERDSVHSTIKTNMIDLSKFANKVLNTKENWSLEGLVRHLLNKRISKDEGVRKGNWSNYPLSEEQKLYAATDAYVSYIIYDKLKHMSKSNA